MRDPTPPTEVNQTGDTALAGAPPVAAPLDLAVARARTEAALFGQAEAVKVGRYRVIERAGAGGMGVVWSAWDPELSRGVALKLASSGDAVARARARDEGRALARLSHPNVVPIYDVLEHDDGVFLVMELVKGETLRNAARDQTVPQIVRAYRQAGDGLAAAHHAGLIHRDFKPDNAILGADGRVRVLDFGLAHQVAPDGAAETTAIAGTPRYMAPEQRTASPLTAAVDQYALCVALRETIASRGAIPRWLAPIVARGTAEQPADRYPSMDELLRALALDPATRWRRRALIVIGVAAAAAIAGAFTLGRAGQTESPCEGGPALIAPSWGAARKAAVEQHLRGLTTPYALETVPRLVGALDGYARGWIELHRASCQAHRRAELSTPLFDRRAACLARRRAALLAVTALAGTATVDALPGLVVAVGELPDLAACEDDDALLSSVAPPPAVAAVEAATITDALARVDVERDVGRIADATRNADDALARAKTLGYRPLIARALLARGRVSLSAVADDRGAPYFDAATREGLAVGDEPLAVEAFARHLWAVGTTTDQSGSSDGLPLIEAITDRLGDRAKFARALLHQNIGGVALARGDRAAARRAFEQARIEAREVEGSGAIELTVILAGLLRVVDDPVVREQLATELIAIRTRRLGASHPQTLMARVVAAELLDDGPMVRARLTPACRDTIHFHPWFGALIGECGYELAWLAIVAGDLAEAIAMADAVIAAASSGAPPIYVALARAYRHLAAAELPAALAAVDAIGRDVRLTADSPWWDHLHAADAALATALVHLATGDRAKATRALALAGTYYDAITDAVPLPALRRRRDALATLGARAAP